MRHSITVQHSKQAALRTPSNTEYKTRRCRWMDRLAFGGTPNAPFGALSDGKVWSKTVWSKNNVRSRMLGCGRVWPLSGTR